MASVKMNILLIAHAETDIVDLSNASASPALLYDSTNSQRGTTQPLRQLVRQE